MIVAQSLLDPNPVACIHLSKIKCLKKHRRAVEKARRLDRPESRGPVAMLALHRLVYQRGRRSRLLLRDRLSCERGDEGLQGGRLGAERSMRLFLAGCTEAEAATITGHSISDVRSILDTHYFSPDDALGRSAITKLEEARKSKT